MDQDQQTPNQNCPVCGAAVSVSGAGLVCPQCGGLLPTANLPPTASGSGGMPVIEIKTSSAPSVAARTGRSSHPVATRKRNASTQRLIWGGGGLILVLFVAALGLLIAMLGGSSATSETRPAQMPTPPAIAWPPAASDVGHEMQPAAPNSLADVIDSVGDAVVLISAIGRNAGQSSLGSGVVIRAEGSQENLIVTNYHVVQEAEQVLVRFRDGSELQVDGYRLADAERDLAILQLGETTPIRTTFKIDPLVSIRQGEKVFALGHPQGFDFTASDGIVSAKRQTHELPPNVQQFLGSSIDLTWIQSTAAISGGNSGGPLIDASGKLLGINTWVAGGENLGFALHIQHVFEALGELPAEVGAFPIQQAIGDFAEPTHPDVVDLAAKLRIELEDFKLRLQRAQSAEQFSKILQAYNPAGAYVKKFMAVAQQHKGEQAALESLVMICWLSRWSGDAVRPQIRQSFDQLLSDHIRDAGIKGAVLALLGSDHADAANFLKQLSETVEDAELKGLARFARAKVLLAQTKSEPAQESQVETLLQEIIREHGDLSFAGRTLGEFAAALQFEVRHLRIGKLAAEIEGPDHEGNTFKLSDYGGKVVVLDFWADWCLYCRQMYPQERQLVRDFADRPFALLGVNCDAEARLPEVLRSGEVTWRSWSDGRGGPIAGKWQITAFPTIFVLDHHGEIRFQGLNGEALYRAVALLIELAELESPGADRTRSASASGLDDLIRIRRELTAAYVAQEEWPAAIDQLQRLQSPLAERLQSDPGDVASQEKLLEVLIQLAEVNIRAGNPSGARTAYEEALGVLAGLAPRGAAEELLAKAARCYLGIGRAANEQQDYPSALVAYQSAVELNPTEADTKNGLAWFLATCPQEEMRNGKLAVELAQSVCELSQWREFGVVDTLAAAMAESGDFGEAVRRQEQAIALAPEEWKSVLKARLARYQSDEPFREGT